MKPVLYELWVFGLKQVRACVFAGSFFLLLFLSHHIPLGDLPRYDFLFLAAVFLQACLYFFRIETKDELKVIFLFHLIGLMLEIYKTSPLIASWDYPEAGFFKVLDVPLYSGFMYAAVASYISQAWRIFQLEFKGYPAYRWSVPLSVLIYLNFFTHHFLFDFRWLLMASVLVVFAKARVYFTVIETRRSMPLVLAFFLIGFFIWIAENIATFLGAWQYPDQVDGWQLVDLSKINSWFLLVIVSIIIVADLKHLKAKRARESVDS